MKIRNADSPRYFLYLSTAKVDMLYGQLSSTVETRVSIDAKIKLGLLESSGSKETTEATTKEDRLDAVIKALEEAGSIGTIDAPKEYVRATMLLKWGLFQDGGRPEGEPPLVFFGGMTQNTVLGLGGSTRHVLGCSCIGNTTSRSVTPYLVAHLLEAMGIPARGWESFGPREDTKYHAIEAIVAATERLSGPSTSMEFVAKSLLRGKFRHPLLAGQQIQVLLGSPLYVVQTAPFAEIRPPARIVSE